MSAIRRPDTPVLHVANKRPSRCWRWLRALFLVFSLCFIPCAHAQPPGAQQAIEALENCGQKDRQQGCVKILKRKPAGDDKEAIKAQVRGGRIIWYEYDVKTGRARRTN